MPKLPAIPSRPAEGTQQASLPPRPAKSVTVSRVTLRQITDGELCFPDRVIRGPKDVFEAVRPVYRYSDREILSVIGLGASNRPNCFSTVAIGGMNRVHGLPADVLKAVILSNSDGMILVHNHPCGDPEPGPEDIEYTLRIRDACSCLGLRLHDHVIVTDDQWVSLRERGVL